MTWWAVLDVSGWPEIASEARGLRAKAWIASGEQRWLRKEPRPRSPYEPAIEAFTLELGRRAGVPVALGRPCTWSANDRHMRGFASPSFVGEGDEAYDGSMLLEQDSATATSDDEAPATRERARRIAATLAAVRAALEAQEKRYGACLVPDFVRILVFDAWVGNGDRHAGNWAIVVHRGTTCRLAPMFDTAGCLGSELDDGHPHLQSVVNPAALAEYVRRCPSGFGDGLKTPGVRQTQLCQELASWPEWEPCCKELVPAFQALTAHADALLDEIPDDWLPGPRKRFAAGVLAERARLLEGALP